jgi:hypothetical protein
MTHITLTPEQVAQVSASALKETQARAKRSDRQYERKLAAANERTVDWKTRALKYRKELLEAKQEIDTLRQRRAGEGPDQWSWHAKDYAAAIKKALAAPAVQPVPIKPVVDPDLDVNQRLAFKLGWKSAEEAHGITKGQP